MDDITCTILIADDDKFIRDNLRQLLENTSHKISFSETAEETILKAQRDSPDLILLDIRFPDSNDLEPLKRIVGLPNAPEVIILTSQTDDISQVVEAIKLGAYDYVPKPFDGEELLNRVEKALQNRSLMRERSTLLREISTFYGTDHLIGNSPLMAKVRKDLGKLANLDGCVLIMGESGTGKELAARALHFMGKRKSKPFSVVNCAAVPDSLTESILFGHRKGAFTGANENAKGHFEAAENGTIFLDEIGDMPMQQQASLLRVLEYRTFTPVGSMKELECHARFVLATNQNLQELVDEGQFRKDLYYRIKVASIHMPSLSSRPEDIPELALHLVSKYAKEMGRTRIHVSHEVIDLFKKYDWPGNVRELKNVLEASIMLMEEFDNEITIRSLPPELLAIRNDSGESLGAKEVREKEKIIRALRDSNGNQSKAAAALGVHRNTIRTKIRYYGLSNWISEK